MDVATVVVTVSSGIAIAGSVGGVARWYVKQHSVESIKDYLEDLKELRPNHGSSLNDAVKLEILPIIKSVKEDIKEIKEDVKELRTHQIEIVKDLSRLEGRVQAHIEEPRK
jgi:hypothetical protein